MKKIFSFAIVLAAVAMVSCCGNGTMKTAEGEAEAMKCEACEKAEACDKCKDCENAEKCENCAENCDKCEKACCDKAEGEAAQTEAAAE